MKISILGYSGSGKSTLARLLGEKYHAEVLHFDAIHWLPGWQENTKEEKLRLTEEFLDMHESWVIDGNYKRLFLERRLDKSDIIIFMIFNRFSCLIRVIKRYFTYKGRTRPDMGAGCDEKIDLAFVKWVLWEGRSREHRELFKSIAEKYPEKVTVIKNQRQLDRFTKRLDKSYGKKSIVKSDKV